MFFPLKKEQEKFYTETPSSDTIDLKKRKIFFLSLSLTLYPLAILERKEHEVPGEKGESLINRKSSKSSNFSDFLSFILGEKISDDEAKNLLMSIKNIRKKLANEYEYRILNSIPLENFLYFASGLPRAIFDFGFRLPKKLRKIFFFSLKIPLFFSFYSDEKVFGKIGYSGPFVGKAKFPRYQDPKIQPSYFKKDGSFSFSFDVCIIGSGAGGSIAALLLSQKSSVCIIERGKLIKPYEFTEKEDEMIPKLYRIGIDKDLSIISLSGNCVGGSTVHNTALFVRLPEKILQYWFERGFPIKDLPVFSERIFSICEATKIEEKDLNQNARVCAEGMKKLGISFFLPYHGRRDCLKVGFCELGCYWNRKFSALLNILPKATKNGAVIFPESKVIYLDSDGKKVKAVFVKHKGEIFKVKAKKFILSAGALSSPLTVKNSFGIEPEGLCLHPSSYVLGVFDSDISGWLGIPITLISDEFLKEDGGFILLPYFMHPATFSLAVGGFGSEHSDIMKKYKNIACVSFIVHDESSGKVIGEGPISFKYSFSKRTFDDVKNAILKSSEILFEAGAKEVILPHIFSIKRAKGLSEVKRFVENISPYDIPFISVHPQATLSWVKYLDEEGRLKGFENLWVADASAFPSSCGVPPQVSVMSISSFVSDRILETL